MQVTRLLHMSIHTPRLGEASSFYKDVLGLPELTRPDMAVPGLWLLSGGVEIHLNGRALTAADNGGPFPRHICLGVSDLAVAIDTLEAHGIKYVEAGSLGTRQIWLRDPAGNAIELQADAQ